MARKYTAYLSSAYYIYNKQEKAYEWAENDPDTVVMATFDTFDEAMNHINKESEGSRWILYSAAFIETEEDGEVWSSIPALHKCECCGNETWDRIESDMRKIFKIT